jgi:hypothetical protein
MAGYLLIHRSQFKPAKASGFEPNANRLGALDYLRELRQNPFPFPDGHRLLVEGFDEVLVAAGEKHCLDVARFIHHTLAARANELTAMGGHVQLLFRHPLRYGAGVWIESGVARFDLLPAFGTLQHMHDARAGLEWFTNGFNLA